MEIKNGNLIDALLNKEINYLAHCCNCQNDFGAGIAREIKDRIPSAYKLDCLLSNNFKPEQLLGECGFDEKGSVFNLYGQLNYGYGRQVNYGAYASSLAQMLKYIEFINEKHKHNDITIGFPYKIASDRAGGDWELIKEITDGILVNKNVKWVFYRL